MNNTNIKIPNHLGIIVDGNGRWAKERNLPRSKGHDKGFKRLKEITSYGFDKGIKVISVYVFSTENFKRSNEEVNHLMDLFVTGFKKDKFYLKENIKVIFSGKEDNLRQDVIDAMNTIKEETKNNTKGILNICLNYGGRDEIVTACKKFTEEVLNRKTNIDDLNEQNFSKYLYQDLPDIDFMIRTSGEERLSNFMLWQNSYAEFYFPKTYFPDFSKDEFDKALLVYTKRDRRFGNINYNK